jgi:polysaccharide biosynthesis transport protein
VPLRPRSAAQHETLHSVNSCLAGASAGPLSLLDARRKDPSLRMDDNSAREPLLVVVRRRWLVILACTVFGGAAAFGFSQLEHREYTASSLLLFRNPGFDQQLFGYQALQPNTDPTRLASTNMELVSLPIVASQTAAVLHMSASDVSSAITVSGVGQADVAQVNATDPSPVRAARIANTYAQQYVLYRQHADRAEIAGAQHLVQTQLQSMTPAQRIGTLGQGLQTRAQELEEIAALQTGNAEVVQPAGIPTSPSAPNTKRNGILGLLLGLLLGVGLAFVAERLDRRLRDVSELEEAYGAPVLGAVPASARFALAGTDPLAPREAEVFALIRSRLRYFNVDHDVRSLLVTSAVPGEGKTTIALNLAIAEAMAGNAKVLLLEADFRRPTLARRLGIQRGPGVGEILSRNISLDAAFQHVYVPRAGNGVGETATFTVLTAGALLANPTELVESHAMVELLAALSELFDLIILDSPPTSVVPDAIPLTRLVSGVVIASRLRVTSRDAAHQLRDQLIKLQAHTLGVIANAASEQRPRRESYPDASGPVAPSPSQTEVNPHAVRSREVNPQAVRSRIYVRYRARTQSAAPPSAEDSHS